MKDLKALPLAASLAADFTQEPALHRQQDWRRRRRQETGQPVGAGGRLCAWR